MPLAIPPPLRAEPLEDRRMLALVPVDSYALAWAESSPGYYDQDGGDGFEGASAYSEEAREFYYVPPPIGEPLGTESARASAAASGLPPAFWPPPPQDPLGAGAKILANGRQSGTLYDDYPGPPAGAGGSGQGGGKALYEFLYVEGEYSTGDMLVRVELHGRWSYEGESDEDDEIDAGYEYNGNVLLRQWREVGGIPVTVFQASVDASGDEGDFYYPHSAWDVSGDLPGWPGGDAFSYEWSLDEPTFYFDFRYEFLIEIEDGDHFVFEASTWNATPYWIGGYTNLFDPDHDSGGSTISGSWSGSAAIAGRDLNDFYVDRWPPPIPGDTTPPRVVDVTISETDPGYSHDPYSFDTANADGSGEQLRTVPVGGANTVKITFSEAVRLVPEDLSIIGLRTGNVPTVADFSLDGDSATWVFDAPFAADQYLIRLSDWVSDGSMNWLDGEWVNPTSFGAEYDANYTFPSGDGVAGGDFAFVFTILPGDANRNNVVNGLDAATLAVHWLQSGMTFTDGDFNGEGYIDGLDSAMLGTNWLKDFRYLEILADLDGDYDVDGDDESTFLTLYNAQDGGADLNHDDTVDESDLAIFEAFAQFRIELDVFSDA